MKENQKSNTGNEVRECKLFRLNSLLPTSLLAIKKPRLHLYKEVPDGLECLQAMNQVMHNL